MRLKISTLVAMLPLLAGPSIAPAQDASRLANLLIPAYTAMYYASLCGSNTTWAQTQPKGPRGSVVHYAEHIKNEIIQNLSQAESVTILTDAAGRARDVAREQLRSQVIMGDQARHEQRLVTWCGGFVSDFAAKVINEHDQDHDNFLRQVDQAKRPSPKSEGEGKETYGAAGRETSP